MNALDALRVTRSHPIILAVCLALTIIGCFGVYKSLPIRYQDGASLVLLPPGTIIDQKGNPVRINPLQNAGDGPAQISASTLVLIGNSGSFQAGLQRSGVTSTSVLQVSADGGGIVIVIVTTSKSAPATSSDVPKIIAALRVELRRQQASLGAPANTYYDLKQLTGPGLPTQVSGGKIKTSAIAGA